jgi:hypothetical protein
MVDVELERRLGRAARALDEQAPAFDVTRLAGVSRGRLRTRARVVAFACAGSLALVAAAPTALTAIRDLIEIDMVTRLDAVEPGVAPAFAGRGVGVAEARAWAPFRVRTISALGVPTGAYVRDDVTGGMVTIAHGGIRLTQWPARRVAARLAVVPVRGQAEDVGVGGPRGVWIEGAARGTFTLVGADGAVHREHFDVGGGVLLWEQDGMAFLLHGAGSKAEAVRLGAALD